MAEGSRTLHLVTADESLFASARDAARALEGWSLSGSEGVDSLLAARPEEGDVILLDGGLASANVYEACRRLTGRTRCRTYVVIEPENELAGPLAHFCGATGVIERPLDEAALQRLAAEGGPRPAPPSAQREEGREPVLPPELLRDLSGQVDERLVAALVDPETQLFNYAFLNYKLEEEFKRAQRFEQPLSCVMLGIEGQASEQVLRELAGIFLVSSRDTDILGRFDETSFLFLLPNTGPDGAGVMARRVEAMALERGLEDLLGERLSIAAGISFHPHPQVRRREDLFGRAQEAFLAARREGGGVVTA